MKFNQQQINQVIQIAREAGEAIMGFFQKDDLESGVKKDSSPVTEADLTAHNLISSELRKAFNIPILSEEKVIPYSERKNWQTLWCVDPLDGTKEFMAGRKEFTVNIALIHENAPVFGVLYAPALDQLCWAQKGEGAFSDQGEQIFNSNKNISEFSAAISRSHSSNFVGQFLTRNKITKFKKFGSALKFAALARGDLDIYPRFRPTSEWDTAAGQIIAEEAGCQVISLETQESLQYNRENLINPYFIAARKELKWDLQDIPKTRD